MTPVAPASHTEARTPSGKIHERCCQGLIASSASQRPIVDADASLIACSTTKRCSSDRLKRDSGTPWALGSSHAIALTCATSSGGKTARTTRPRSILETLDALSSEPFSPAGDAIGGHIEARGDLEIGEPLGRQQHQLRTHHHAVGQRQAARAALELTTNLGVELDRCRHSSHAITFVNSPAAPSTRRNLRRAALSEDSRLAV
jgi:hypothetical protein